MMRRWMTVMIATVFTMMVLTGCELGGKLYNSIAPQAMGVILYGDTEAVQSDMERVMKELKTSEIHTMKVVDDVEQRGIILKKSTAESLLAKGLFRKVVGKTDTEQINELPAISNDEGVLFAKEEPGALTIQGEPLNVKYEGDIIIGNGRSYAKMVLIVDDALRDFHVDAVQLVEMK